MYIGDAITLPLLAPSVFGVSANLLKHVETCLEFLQRGSATTDPLWSLGEHGLCRVEARHA
jgi:hypothetical protein